MSHPFFYKTVVPLVPPQQLSAHVSGRGLRNGAHAPPPLAHHLALFGQRDSGKVGGGRPLACGAW
jgi:hypothetical protein